MLKFAVQAIANPMVTRLVTLLKTLDCSLDSGLHMYIAYNYYCVLYIVLLVVWHINTRTSRYDAAKSLLGHIVIKNVILRQKCVKEHLLQDKAYPIRENDKFYWI